jgi:tetratricopeptide (TPR) repeat protein
MRFTHFLAALLVLAFVTGQVLSKDTKEIAQATIRKGNDLVAEGRYQDALKEYETVTADAGEIYAVALYNIGVCYYELWQTERAIGFYQHAIESRKGGYPRAWYALGIALEDKGSLREAEAAYKQALLTSRDNYPLANFRLGLLASSKDLKTAIEFFRKALRDPGEHHPATHNNLGVMLARMRRLNEAEKEFVIALRQARGDFSDAAYNLDLCRRLLARRSDVAAVALRISGGREIN